MIGYDELAEWQVANLKKGTEVYLRLVGDGWLEEDYEYEGIYHVGDGRKLWNADSDRFYFIYEMNIRNYEFKVYLPARKYKIQHILKEIQEISNIYNMSFKEIINEIEVSNGVSKMS